MAHDHLSHDEKRTISATELAEMGVCEKKIRFRQLLGRRQVSKQREEAQREGTHDHETMHRASANESKSPCFIATAIYGIDAAETDLLRRFRDTRLLPHWWGKLAVAIYYRASPRFVLFLTGSPLIAKFVKSRLDKLIQHLEGRRDVD